MIKNHCSNVTALEGVGFKIDEIVQAWNDMYDVKKVTDWCSIIPTGAIVPLPYFKFSIRLGASLSFLLVQYSFSAFDKCKCFSFCSIHFSRSVFMCY
ncbi:hypothetical protein HRI_002366600 [Hibiscus trionum]|uniref:Uncharacterized protein n=1 Tax=Hibiscus trionum TaxID=183268 RepID=A0A9W7M3Y7_HIBTR|nr:hypothetical protein HRI_002366600 [Hibiscus trionum]